MNEEAKQLYIVSSSPHAHSGDSVRQIMLDVIIALIPAAGLACYLFLFDAVRLISTCVVTCVATEWLCRKAMKRDAGIGDLSAVVTGILLALNLPPSLPSWMAAAGSAVAIAIAKQLFGGIGYNPFNPALVGRAALLISFTGPMTSWHAPVWSRADAATIATPLQMVRQVGVYNFTNQMAMNACLGNIGGSIGEVSVVALLIGGAYLLWRRCISWHVPVSYVGTVALFALVLWLIDPHQNMPPHFHVLTGGLMLGAVFMATDMVTSPVTRPGMIVFGIGCGLLTMIIRRWGGYPEGTSFAILIMNAFTPLINRATRPRLFGKRKAKA